MTGKEPPPPPRRRRRLLRGLLLALASSAVCLVAAELGYRGLMRWGGERWDHLRDASQYADFASEDLYWQLYHEFGGTFAPPDRPHPKLGWTGDFDRESYLHRDAGALAGRRPVLLYGDSFSACVSQVRCFQDFLNEDAEFARDHHLLNYGVGGYGLGQIYLLLRDSLEHYEDPFVVVGLMTFDLDRSVLSVRTGQKPRLDVIDDELVPVHPPIEADYDDYRRAHPSRVVSFLYRRWLFSRFAPRGLFRRLTGEAAAIAEKQRLNRRILEELVAELRSRDLDFVFLVFHHRIKELDDPPGERDWRDELLARFFEDEDVPAIWATELALAQGPRSELRQETFTLPSDGHPTSGFNELVSTRIREVVLGD